MLLWTIPVLSHGEQPGVSAGKDYDHSICATPVVSKSEGIYTLQRLTKPTTGDTTFKIRKNVLSTSPQFIEIGCYKLLENSDIIIYAEVEQYDSGYVSDTDVNSIERYFCEETPQGSIAPQDGILSILTNTFGSPPDVDGNGKIILLLIDVRDDYSEENNQTYVAGYFDPYDQQKTYGNYGDIIYVDTNPAKASDLNTLSTVAHEFQHLIHYKYDKNEETWLNEALSELAPRICGLPARSFGRYLNNPGKSLISFDNTLYDYTESALFSYYLFKQYHQEFFLSLVADGSGHGLNSLENILQQYYDPSLTAKQLFYNWTIANGLQGNGVYGYGDSEIPALIPNHDYSSLPVTPEEDYVQKFGSKYISFNAGMNIDFNLQHNESYGISILGIKFTEPATVFIERDISQNYNFSDPEFGIDYQTLMLIPVYTPISKDSTLVTFNAEGKGGYEEYEIAYDNDEFTLIDLAGMTAAVKFPINPAVGEKLDRVKIYLYNDEATTIGIMNSLRGSVVYSTPVISGGGWTTVSIPEGTLSANASQFFVTVTSQSNALGYSGYMSGEGISYLKPGSSSSFQPLSNFQIGNGETLTGNWGIRAVLHIPLQSRLEVSTEYIDFRTGSKNQFFLLSNPGLEKIAWQIENPNDWLQISPDTGSTLFEYDTIRIANLLDDESPPGNYFGNIRINTSNSQLKLFAAATVYDQHSPQVTVIPAYINLDSLVNFKNINIINSGTGSLRWNILEQLSSVLFYPNYGLLFDSVKVLLEVDRTYMDQGSNLFSIPIFSEYNTDTLHLAVISQNQSAGKHKSELTLRVLNQPFNPERDGYLRIRYDLPVADKIKIRVFNLLGQQVYSEPTRDTDEGINQFLWDGKMKNGKDAPSGFYLVQVKGKNASGVGRIIVIR